MGSDIKKSAPTHAHCIGMALLSFQHRIQLCKIGEMRAAGRHLCVAGKDGVRVGCMDCLQALQGCLRLGNAVHNVHFPGRCCYNICEAAKLLCICLAVLWWTIIITTIAVLHAQQLVELDLEV